MPLLIPGRVSLPDGPLSEEALRALLAGYEAGHAEDPLWYTALVCLMFLWVVMVALYLQAGFCPRGQRRNTASTAQPTTTVPAPELDLEARLLSGEVYIPNETDRLRTQTMAQQAERARLCALRVEDLKACRALGTKLAKANAALLVMKSEPTLTLSEDSLPPTVSGACEELLRSRFPDISRDGCELHCAIQPLGAIAFRVLTCRDGHPKAMYIEMTRAIGGIGGGRSLAEQVQERAAALGVEAIIL